MARGKYSIFSNLLKIFLKIKSNILLSFSLKKILILFIIRIEFLTN